MSGLMRRCFYTGFVAAEERPGRGWRQGDLFKEDADSDEEEVVYEQQRNKKGMFYEERKRSVQMREMRQTDLVQEVAVAVVQKEPSMLLKKEEKHKEEKEQMEKKKLHSSRMK